MTAAATLSVVAVALALALALAIAATVTAVIAQRAVKSWRERVESLEAGIAALRCELELVASISARTGRLLQRFEQEFSGVADRIDLVESRGAAMPGSLDEAITWARRGADTDKLEKQFGLTSAEAELVSRLHGVKRSA